MVVLPGVGLVPVVVITMILSQALELMMKVAQPLAAWFPVDTIGGVALANILAAVSLVLVSGARSVDCHRIFRDYHISTVSWVERVRAFGGEARWCR